MDEVWQLPLLVDGLAGRADAVGERAGAAAEHAHFAHLENVMRSINFVRML